jgi:phospholipase C
MRFVLPAAALCALVACSGSPASSPPAAKSVAVLPQTSSSNYIAHVVLVVQENRSFDDFFAKFPGADGTRFGKDGGKRFRLREVPLLEPCDFGHAFPDFTRDYDGGKMDGFGEEGGSRKCPGKAGRKPYQYVNPEDIAPYWDIAKEYVLGDHMFQTQGSGSFTAHQDLIRGGTTYHDAPVKSLVDFPTNFPWGCDAPAGTKTSYLIVKGAGLRREHDRGPFPCTSAFGKYDYDTLRDLLDAKSVSWKYYTPPVGKGSGSLWSAFDVVAAVRYGPEWSANVVAPNIFFSDVAGGTLPAMSWVIPDTPNSDHPIGSSDTGPSWVASIVNAVGKSSYWNSTAIVVVWDDWGGFYDHEPPPFHDNWGGLGFRVPMLLISPYARESSSSQPGYISHTQYEFGSILKFVEQNWKLGSLGTTDKRATSIIDCFDFTQQPRTFTKIPSKYSPAYFERQPYSYTPVDTE